MIADTSRLSYQELLSTLPQRERAVWHALSQCSHPPTAYELVQIMCARDVNVVRPRLSGLFDKGCVARVDKRRCAVTGKTAWTWRVVTRPEPVPVERRLW